jgi:hypothetical protein
MKTTLLVLLISTLSFAEEVKKPSQVPEKMQKLYLTLSDILTQSSSLDRFNDKSNQSKIEENLKTLSTLSHSMNDREFKGENSDPTLTILSGYLSEETKTAYTAFKNGKKEFSRNIIRSIPGTCIACHSRTDSGAQFDKLGLEPSDNTLKPNERAEFYAATRQYDRAEKSFLEIIENQTIATTDPYTWENAVKQSVTIAVRVKKDAQLAKTIIETALKQKKAAYYVREDLNLWKKSVEQWLKEPKKKLQSERGLLAEGMKLIADAHRMQKYPMDHAADILYLRASSTFYDLIQKAPAGKNVSEALMMQGICNEVLNPKGFEDLHRLYYESCIRKTPHSSIAMDCYRRYERSTVQGYTGRAGTMVPDDIKQKLLDLFSLSVGKGSPDQVY